jgi:UDP-2,3-diacylglucosamine pyrophosphatase LpxH
MRKLLRILLLRPILWAAAKFSSKPKKQKIFEALSALFKNVKEEPGKRGLIIPFEHHAGKFIIFSDQHKGRRNGADDFTQAEPNYLAALDYYSNNDFCFINLGDSEELWENTLWQVRKKNKATFEAEKKFLANNKYVKISGNHDLYWNTSPLASLDLLAMYGEKVKVYDAVVLQTLIDKGQSAKTVHQQTKSFTIDHSPLTIDYSPLTIFLTHGHQGDAQSDGNWFSKFFVGWIWAPMQALLRINPNTPAYNAEKKTLHNSIMYEWSSAQKDMLLVTGHTHQPVFKSLTHLEKLYKEFQFAERDKNETQLANLLDEIKTREKEFTAVASDYMSMKPSYFNTGCCCFSDGDITGIEIADGSIRLIKWCLKEGRPERQVLEEVELEGLMREL